MTLTIIRAFLHKMTSSGSSSLVPLNVRGMTVFDREKFLRNVQIAVLKLKLDQVANVSRCCRPFSLVKLENFKPLQNLDDETYQKCLYLHPEKVTRWEDIEESARDTLKQYDVDEKNFDTKEVQFSYDNWSYDTIFKEVLPKGEEKVSGFTQMGHLIHLNLRDHLLDYRYLIGQVLLDKIKSCRTVVTKKDTIDNTYRNFSMEVIAGEEDYIVTVKENNCNFKLDFAKVYWNSRLGMEHERVLKHFNPQDILFDVFCGVGPFSIPAAKKYCKVFANDLNPESYKWLNYNAEQNKVNMLLFQTYNQDGKDFILNVFKDYIFKLYKDYDKIYSSKIHVTMNLPGMAVQFLKYFKGLINNYDQDLVDKFDLEIFVYVYCFVTCDESKYEVTAKQMISDNIGCDMSSYIIDIFDVRRVAPHKEMLRVTFKLTKEVIFDLDQTGSLEEPPSKKQCLET